MFLVADVAAEQARVDRHEIVPTGPMFGKKMRSAAGAAADREAKILEDAGLGADSFRGHGALLQGTRRHSLIYIDDLAGAVQGTDVLLTFTLPAGSYATILIREITKSNDMPNSE
jgi:tRNA pseudouridine13 synthase